MYYTKKDLERIKQLVECLQKDVQLLYDSVGEDRIYDDPAYFYAVGSIEYDFTVIKEHVEYLIDGCELYEKSMESYEDYIDYLIHLKTPILNRVIDRIKKLFKKR